MSRSPTTRSGSARWCGSPSQCAPSLAAEAVRDRQPAIASERLRSDPDPRGRLAALVLGAIDHGDHLVDDLGWSSVGDDLVAAAVLLDVGGEDAVEELVRRQRVLVELPRA